ncbi:MAG: AAA family ATPase [Acidimicrobiia bacterium]
MTPHKEAEAPTRAPAPESIGDYSDEVEINRFLPEGPAPLDANGRRRVELELARLVDDPLRAIPGGRWIFDRPEQLTANWGEGDEIAWVDGEALMVVGGDGAGKTVLAGNLILRQLGIVNTPLLGLPVRQQHRILYLAQDRPAQAARAFKRMVGLVDRVTLDNGLRVIDFPIGHLEGHPELLLEHALDCQATVVYVDSIKDVATEISGEVSGQAVKNAYQLCIHAGIGVCLLHHDRKAIQTGKPRKLLTLADVYGNRFMVAGCGSVIALNGRSGDPVVDLRHLKQPAAEVGPLKVLMNFETGDMTIYDGGDLLALLTQSRHGLTAQDAARQLYETENPTASERERARRKLKGLVERHLAFEKPPDKPNDPAVFYATTGQEETLTLPLTEEVVP